MFRTDAFIAQKSCTVFCKQDVGLKHEAQQLINALRLLGIQIIDAHLVWLSHWYL